VWAGCPHDSRRDAGATSSGSDPSLRFGISPAGFRFAHACNPAQVI